MDTDEIVARIPVVISNWPFNTIVPHQPSGEIANAAVDTSKPSESFTTPLPAQQPAKTRKLYLIQYPLRQSDRPLMMTPTDKHHSITTKLPVRVKPSVDIVQMQFPLDQQSDYYCREKGVQLRRGLEMAFMSDSNTSTFGNKQDSKKADPGAASDNNATMGIDRVERLVLEKNRWTSSGIPFESQKVLDGQSDRGRLMVGYVSDGVVYLTPLDAVLQSRPHLKHVDAIDAQSKQLLANNKRDSTDESGGSEAEDQTAAMAASKRLTLQKKQDAAAAALLSGKRQLLQRTIEEEDWVPLDYQQRSDPAALGEILCSRQTDSGRAGMKTTMKPEEYFEQLGK